MNRVKDVAVWTKDQNMRMREERVRGGLVVQELSSRTWDCCRWQGIKWALEYRGNWKKGKKQCIGAREWNDIWKE